MILLFLLLLLTPAFGESVLIEAEDMEGNWPKGMAFGASGIARESNGTPLTKSVNLDGGDYQVYIRAVSSSSQRAIYRLSIGDQQLVSPAQDRDVRIGWIRVGRVRIPARLVKVSVEAGEHETLDAIALSSDPLTDRPGHALAFNEYILKEVARMTTPLAPPSSAEEARRRQEVMRQRLLRGIGMDTLPRRTPLHPISTGKIDRAGYFIEKVAFESRPRHVVPGLLYVPKDARFPVPAVVGVIGHWNSGKSSTVPQLRSIGLVKRGYVVLNIDPCYAWERRIPGNSEGSDPYISGASINGHMAWDVMRAIDYLETRKEVDPELIGLTGASGGGQQTLYAGAIDQRIKAVAPAVYIWAYKDITAHWGYSSDNWVPGVLQNGDMAATLALIAPRALLVLSVTQDYVNLEGSKQQVEQARGFYKTLGVEEKISQFVAPGGHDYSKPMREAMYGFMDRWLKGMVDSSPQPEPPLDPFPEDAKELLVFPGGKIPVEGAATVRSIWTDHAIQLRSRLPAHNPAIPEVLRQEILRLPPRRKPVAREVPGGLLIATEPGIEIPAVRIGSGSRAAVWISQRDVVTEAASEEVQALARNATVLVVEPRSMSMAADRGLANQAAILMGRPLVGMWTYDVMQAIDYLLDEQGLKSVSIAASGVYPGLVGMMATVLDSRVDRAAIDGLFSSFISAVGKDPIAEIPGILRLADIDQLVTAAGASRIAFNDLQASPVQVRVRGDSKILGDFMNSVLLDPQSQIELKPWARPLHGSSAADGQRARVDILVKGLPGRGRFDSLVVETLNGFLEGAAKPFSIFQPRIQWTEQTDQRCAFRSADPKFPVQFEGSFHAHSDFIDVMLAVRNASEKVIRHVWIWPCFELAEWPAEKAPHIPDPAFGDRELARLFVITPEGLTSLARFGEPYRTGGDRFIQLGLLGQPITAVGMPPLLAPAFIASAPDGLASVGMAWSDGLVFSSNVARPCWHITQQFGDLMPDAQRSARGRYYFTHLTATELWKRMRTDFPEWRR